MKNFQMDKEICRIANMNRTCRKRKKLYVLWMFYIVHYDVCMMYPNFAYIKSWCLYYIKKLYLLQSFLLCIQILLASWSFPESKPQCCIFGWKLSRSVMILPKALFSFDQIPKDTTPLRKSINRNCSTAGKKTHCESVFWSLADCKKKILVSKGWQFYVPLKV